MDWEKAIDMQDILRYAKKNGIELETVGGCQFCGSRVSHGVLECIENTHYIGEILDFNNSVYYVTRFLSVDAMALQHCEIHGPWSNHIHLTRLFLILEKKVNWDYGKTPQLSGIINQYKKNKAEYLTPPPFGKRGKVTTSDLLLATTPTECMDIVGHWANDVFGAYHIHHSLVSSIAGIFLEQYPV